VPLVDVIHKDKLIWNEEKNGIYSVSSENCPGRVEGQME
jgi:hypothetical protein